MYRIVEWDRLYEVNSNNTSWQPGQKKRMTALNFIRCKVSGRHHGESYRVFLKICKEKGVSAAASFGVFMKCLELAADQTAEFRGVILDRNQQPLDAEGIAELLDFEVAEVWGALSVLIDSRLNWVIKLENQLQNGKNRKNFAEKIKDSEIFSDSSQVLIPQQNVGVPFFSKIKSSQVNTREVKSEDVGEPVALIPTQSEYEVYELYDSNIQDLLKQFPGVDVLAELKEIRVKLEANRKLAPRPEKAAKFVLRCLGNAAKKTEAVPVALSDVAVMGEVHRKWPEVSKTEIADFFDEVCGECGERDDRAQCLEKMAGVLKQSGTWNQFKKLAKVRVGV